ncbi:hypothetical protein BKA93DRAFT_726919 [Sparassis latifolia]
MGRWTQYDEDDYRLPEGMKRVGYDADSGKYYFRDQDGTLWEGAEGAEYGEMKRAAPSGSEDDENDLEAAPGRGDGYLPLSTSPDQAASAGQGLNTSAYRMLFPFILLVAVVLLLVIRLVHSPSAPEPDPPEVKLCPGSSDAFRVRAGDTCWGLSQARGVSVDKLLEENPGLDCDKLMPGQTICLPDNVPSSAS